MCKTVAAYRRIAVKFGAPTLSCSEDIFGASRLAASGEDIVHGTQAPSKCVVEQFGVPKLLCTEDVFWGSRFKQVASCHLEPLNHRGGGQVFWVLGQALGSSPAQGLGPRPADAERGGPAESQDPPMPAQARTSSKLQKMSDQVKKPKL